MQESRHDAMWARHAAEWRDNAQICSQWREASAVDSRLLHARTSGAWWETLNRLKITLFVTREYEHLAMALTFRKSPRITYFPAPHPSGLVADRTHGRVFLASSRNPNQIYMFQPVTGVLPRKDVLNKTDRNSPLLPVSTWFYPGCMYFHDLALIQGKLYANAVGHNAVVRVDRDGKFTRAWWPRCIETSAGPAFDRNYIQLNSIAPGRTLRDSFFTASSDRIGPRRPGHLNYPVKGRGVIISGKTRQPVCRGLTRPHSARLSEGKVWVANSGFGEVGFVRQERLEIVARLPGWTRGLCVVRDVIFAATSRVIPRYAVYAPGLDSRASRCGVHAICKRTGALLGSLEWPDGNQIFAIDWAPAGMTAGFPFTAGSRRAKQERILFYSYANNRSTGAS
jgi:uncharacterized protein (TIGR03032 family)